MKNYTTIPVRHNAIQGILFGAVLYVGVGPAALGFYAWNAGVARLGPSGALAIKGWLSQATVAMIKQNREREQGIW